MKTSDNLNPSDPENIPEQDQIKLEEPKNNKDSKKPARPKTKGYIGALYVESILIDGKPKFLCKRPNERITVLDNIEFEDETLRPLEASECGYIPYTFVSNDIQSLCSKEITKEEILREIKKQIDHFIVVKPVGKTVIQGDLLITYCQEWISTVHYLYFVGETESGKSTGLHLAKWLGYRCLYGEDIPSADIYNFLGLEEEGSGMIAEDEAQDIWSNREKMNMYKNSYSKGSLKSRIVGIDSLKRRQVHYKTFCPKWFAGERIPGNKGFIERLATIYMVEGEPAGNIKRPTKDEVHQLHQLRNKLLIWKLQNIGKEFNVVNSGLKGRDQELWEDFLSLGTGTIYEEIFKETVTQYTEQRQNKIRNSIEAKLFKLVCDKINNSFELTFTSYWDYLVNNNSEISGNLNESNTSTFFADEHPEKITRQFLAKLFEYKFQGFKESLKKRDDDGKQHQTTIYRFKEDVLRKLVKKYGTELPLNHTLYVGELGEHDKQNDNQGNQGNQVTEAQTDDSTKLQIFQCQDCPTTWKSIKTMKEIQTLHNISNPDHILVEIPPEN